ncbi:archease [Candidatus Woesearchaeota archaeon]|nr:archease [Candidatus Woesearchaeota archaeon]
MVGGRVEKKRWEYLPHTADAAFNAYGKTLEEAYSNAALAMANITFDTTTIKPQQQKEINVTGDSTRELLIAFLDEFVFLQDTEGFLLHEINILTIKKGFPWKLHAIVTGDHYKNYTMHGQLVKAVTSHEMRIEEKEHAYKVHVVVDI